MDKESFARYLKERYQDQVGWYDRKAATNQTLYRRLQWSVIILSATTPVLIEIDTDLLPSELFGRLALLTSLSVAILTSALKTFKYQENWINYRTTCETLRKESYFYEAELGEYRDSESKESLFVDRVENLISRENTMWVSTQKLERKAEPADESAV